MKTIEVDGIDSWIHISNLEYFNGPILNYTILEGYWNSSIFL